jgi:hypothetical protein
MSTETRATADHAEGTPTHQECRELVARLVASKHFRRSERHCAFISYVCNVALTEAGREIRETEVGWKVFGRPAGYDTAQDNIVRVNASEVRHRLKEYFQGEGMQEPLGLEIPRGSYRPVFARRSMLVEIQDAFVQVGACVALLWVGRRCLMDSSATNTPATGGEDDDDNPVLEPTLQSG